MNKIKRFTALTLYGKSCGVPTIHNGAIEVCISDTVAELEAKIESMRCCENCKFNNRESVQHGCDGNCVKINGIETWQDWTLKSKDKEEG